MDNRDKIIEQLILHFENMKKLIMSPIDIKMDKVPTPAQARVLFTVFSNSSKTEFTVKEIAEAMNISPSAATQLVDGLVENELLTRTEDTNDRRKLIIKLSETAKNKMIQFRKHVSKKFIESTKNLTDSELIELSRLVNKISSSSK